MDENHDSYLQLYIPIILIIILIIIYSAIHKLFTPILLIKKGAEKIGAGDLTYRIKYQKKNEFSDIINTMANDLEAIFESKRELLMAISHELRTPITRAKINL